MRVHFNYYTCSQIYKLKNLIIFSIKRGNFIQRKVENIPKP